ncbi:MAG: hypothetical protein WCJ61_07335 [Paludibacter sp.]
MAIIKGAIQMTGSIKGVTFYTRRGSDQVIMRAKGGVSKDKIKRLPQFEGMRLQQKEWSGCTKFASGVRTAFGGLHRLADYNLSSVLNGMGNKLQKLDKEGEKGKRPVCLSPLKMVLDGFNFNRNYPFNTVLRVSTTYEINRKTLSASITFPRINTDIDLLNIQRLPYFRVIMVLGTASDMVFHADLNDYVPMVEGLHGASVVTNSDWFPANTVVEEQTLTAQMTDRQLEKLTDNVSVLLSIAVEFGTIGFTGAPVEVKYAGCGKVVKVV